MEKKIIVSLLVGMLTLLSATAVADNISIIHNGVDLLEWGLTEKEIIEKSKLDPSFTIEKMSLPIAQGFFEFSQATQTLDIHKANERKIILKGYQNTNKSFLGPALLIFLIFLLISLIYFVAGYKQEVNSSGSYQASLCLLPLTLAFIFLSVFHAWFNFFIGIFFAIFVIMITLFLCVKVGQFMVYNPTKKMMKTFFTTHYVGAIILFYVAGGIQHALVPMVAIPTVFAFAWYMIKYQTIEDYYGR